MKKRFLNLFLLGILLLFVSLSLPAWGTFGVSVASASEIGRMRVAIWPEHDDSGVLVIYDGRFVDDGVFPREETFILPGGAKISDACSLSPRGQHFCQLYKQKTVGNVDEVRLKLPYPNFYLSFHIHPFDGTSPKRTLDYEIHSNHDVRQLVVDIEEPMRAENFSITPASGDVREEDGFRHHWFDFDRPQKGTIPFNISYKKSDNRPSVDIKYSPMSMKMENGAVKMSHAPEKRSFLDILYVLAGSGVIVLIIMVWFVFRKKKVE